MDSLIRTFERKPSRLPWRRKKSKEAAITRAIDGFSLEVKEGELFGLLGPNGAGKTTLIKILSTLLLPTSGTASVLGHDVVTEADAIRRRIGVVLGGERALYWRLTARENLRFFADLYDVPREEARPRIDHLLQRVGLSDRADERVENYSKGMKQRLHIARGLLNDPELLLLDEPTIGLDPVAARELRAIVRELQKEGRTIVLTTHYLAEADELSDRVAIIDRGRIVALDDPEVLKAQHASGTCLDVSARDAPAKLIDDLRALPGVQTATASGSASDAGLSRYRVLLHEESGHEDTTARVARTVESSGARLISLARQEPSLEDVFVALTGESLGTEDGPSERGGGRHP